MGRIMRVNGRLGGGSKNALAVGAVISVPANAVCVSRLLAWCGNFLNRGGANLASLIG